MGIRGGKLKNAVPADCFRHSSESLRVVPYWRFAARLTACFDAEVTAPIRGAGDLAKTDLITITLFCMIEELILQNLAKLGKGQVSVNTL